MEDDGAQPAAGAATTTTEENGKIKYAPYQGLSFYCGHPSFAVNPKESMKIHYMGSEPVKRVYKNDAEIAKKKE